MTLQSLHSREFDLAFSLYKQSAIGTALTASNIDKMLPYRTFAPTTQGIDAAISDDDWYSKGHNFPTFWDPISKRIVIPSREYSMTNLAAMFALAYVMGAVSSTQPNSASYSSVYDHEFTFQDTETYMECNYTSLLEKAGAAYENLISGVVLEQCSISGNASDHVLLSWQGFGRKQAASAQAMPSLSSGLSFFNFRLCSLSFGESGAAVDVAAALSAFTFTLNQNPNVRRNAGAAGGEETLISRVNVGKQRITGSFTLDKLDSTTRNLFLNNTECELTLVCTGDQIATTPYYHQLTLNIPHYYIPSEAFGEDTDLTTLTLPFNEQTVVKASGEDYCSVTVRTNIDDSEVLSTES